ncbi:SANT/Myb domain [Macleaya cordata]|uniref:SANT/Myb domain n=1 Tax=Macleaya cordata TaxID=56857 RepID=A0A200QZR4_MACCD|nr:SANT/Myb domain [Macleaya cordata]
MHGHGLESVLLVNAEVDSMGGVIDGGVGVDTKASPRRAAIEKAQAELRQEYDVREERRRELEFLEKGGNPLDFKLGPAASISFQSTSLTDQFVTSEAKGSFALTASPPGDSVESSGRPGASLGRETNTADNLLLFDGENDIVEGERNSIQPNRSNIPPSDQSSLLDSIHNAKESEDLATRLAVKSQAYARRNRSRTSRDNARACSTDLAPVGDGKGSSVLPSSRHGSRNAKGLLSEATTKKDHSVSSICNSKSTSPNGDVVFRAAASNQLDMELDAPHARGKDFGLTKSGILEGELVATASKDLRGTDHNQRPQVDADQVPNITNFISSDLGGEKAGVPSDLDCSKMGNVSTFGEPRGLSIPNRDGKDARNEGQNNTATCNKKCLDSESSCTQVALRPDGDASSDQCPNLMKINSNGNSKEQTSVIEESPDTEVANAVKESSEIKDVGVLTMTGDDCNPVHKNFSISGSSMKVEEEICDNRLGPKDEVELVANMEGMEANDCIISKAERKLNNLVGDESNTERIASCPQGRPQSTSVSSQCELPEATFSGRGSEAASELNTCTGSHIKLANKAHEDSVLEEARIIEAKRKRIAELSVGTFPLENRRKSHWDFVLEEMAWLANDFMQERLWKTTIAAQICHLVAYNGRSRFDKQNLCRMQRKIAHTLAKAIMQFWHSAEVLVSSDDPSIGLQDCNLALVGSKKVNGGEAVENKTGEPNMETSKHLEEGNPGKGLQLAIQGYAVRFLKYTSTFDHPDQAEAPLTPDRISDLGIMEWEDQFSEETLFYTVPLCAMEDYRKSVLLQWSQYQKSASNMHQEEVDTSMYDAGADFGSRENAYEEYEGETGTHYLPGAFEGSKSSKFAQKKRKNLPKSYSARSYEMGADMPYGHCVENKMGPHPSFLMGKRPSNGINVGSIPTKRVRTAARQRVVSPFSAGAIGGVQFPNKTDASSGDTSSFQDDQSTVHGGSQIRKGLEVESTGEYGKHLQPDCTEISMKNKKKKAKHLLYKNSLNSPNTGSFVMGKGSAYEQRWPLDSMVQNEQRDHSKKRLESHAFESNGNSGLGGQHVAKKPKIMKQLPDTSPESINPLIGSIPSPVASQVSNLSNPSKLIKMFAGRDRGRKAKALKMSSGQLGLGSPWSQFEDQALVVLVHDMGPNWELVSDVINNTLQFKCIFRKPKDCKERHKFLMDKNAGDGADSAEDSGSSQPYPSTLPGIPKAGLFLLADNLGSARQLFQRLQGPMEEDTLKSHFEKIIFIGQHQHSRKIQNDNQDEKQRAAVHNSHLLALSQVCPNNLNGGPLTPLDLCDATTSSPDFPSLGYQGSHTSGLAMSNQGSVAPVLPTSGSSSMLQGSSGMVLGNSLPSPSAALNASTRDGHRFGGPRPPSLPIDEQQRMQHYNQMLSGRNIQHSGLSVPGSLPGSDRGVRMLAGGNGMGMMCGMNRGMPMPRPGFQGIGSPAMLNMVSSGSMLSTTGVGMPNSVNMHNGSVSGQGTSMMRPRDSLHMIRPGQNPEDQRQIMMQELQMQGNSQGLPPFNGLSTGFSNQTAPPPGQTFSVQHPQQQHPMPSQQSHEYFSDSAAGIFTAVAKPPASPNIIIIFPHEPNNFTTPTKTSPASWAWSESSRHLAQQRQPSQSQQQSKFIKGMGRGNTMMHQNLPLDPSHVNGLATTPGNQVHEKGEQVMHLMQGQGLFSGSNPVQPSKSLVSPQSSNQCSPQQKLFSRSPPSLSKQLPQLTSHPDQTTNQSQPPSVSSSNALLASQQPLPPLAVGSGQQQPQQQQRPNVQRMLQPQNRQMNSDPHMQSMVEQQPANSTLQMGVTESSSVMPVVSSANSAPSQWKSTSEPSHDSGVPNSVNHLSAAGNQPPLTNTVESEPAPSSSGPDSTQKQFPGSMPMHGHNVGTQWQPQLQQQHQPSPAQQPAAPSPSSLPQKEQPHQQPQPQPQQQQQQHLQAGQSGLCQQWLRSGLALHAMLQQCTDGSLSLSQTALPDGKGFTVVLCADSTVVVDDLWGILSFVPSCFSSSVTYMDRGNLG